MGVARARGERGFRRFVLSAMQSPFTLPILGASLLAAVAFGVHLGESSIGLIKPIYFQDPPLHPRDRGAAIDEARLHRSPPATVALYGWEQGYSARAMDCRDCPGARARDTYAYSARVPYFGSRSELRAAVAEARDQLGERFAEVPEDLSPRYSDVERYAYYPVSSEAAGAELALADEAALADIGYEAKKPDQE